MLLSRRRLVFTKSEMYFQCLETYCLESLHPDVTAPDAPLDIFRVFPQQGVSKTTYDLNRRLVEYFPREISYTTDTVDAFAGIFSAFHMSNQYLNSVTHFYGVPVCGVRALSYDARHSIQASLLRGLGWSSFSASSTTTADPLFPSWSWASHKASPYWGSSSKLTTLPHAGEVSGIDTMADISLTHRKNGMTNLLTFFQERHDNKEYLPWIDLDAWVFVFKFLPAQYGRDEWLCDNFRVVMHLDTWICPEAIVKCVYLGELYGIFVQKVDSYSFRRVGAWKIEHTPGYRGPFSIDDFSRFELCENETLPEWRRLRLI